MQYDSATDFTETFNALSVKQPVADKIAEATKYNLLRPCSTSFRGEILIVSSPNKLKERSGMAICKVDLVDCRKVEGGYLWSLENSRRVIEMPCQKSSMRGVIWKCHYTKGQIREYPSVCMRGFMNMPSFSDVENENSE